MRKRVEVIDVIIYLFLFGVLIITFYPFWNVFIISINEPMDTMRGGLYLFPRELSAYSYKAILNNNEFVRSIGVTVLRVIVGTPLSVLLTAMAAYVLSKRDLVGYKVFRTLFIFTMYFGGGLLPFYMTLKTLHLIDSFWVYIFPCAINVFYMLLIVSSIDGLPKELEESAYLDGANDITVFFRIIMPLSKPVLATITLFVAINHWNSFFDSYYYTSKSSLKTLQAVMMKILNQYQTSEAVRDTAAMAAQQQKTVTTDSVRMAATILSTVPIIMLYPFVQKYFVQGVMVGAIKS
ncbi:MAG: carbohydrate ABC transporter permease [Monoglobaceae bacterium]